MIWTCNYVSETQSYESQNIFLLHNPWIEDQFSNMRGTWFIFCFTLHNATKWTANIRVQSRLITVKYQANYHQKPFIFRMKISFEEK